MLTNKNSSRVVVEKYIYAYDNAKNIIIRKIKKEQHHIISKAKEFVSTVKHNIVSIGTKIGNAISNGLNKTQEGISKIKNGVSFLNDFSKKLGNNEIISCYMVGTS